MLVAVSWCWKGTGRVPEGCRRALKLPGLSVSEHHIGLGAAKPVCGLPLENGPWPLKALLRYI